MVTYRPRDFYRYTNNNKRINLKVWRWKHGLQEEKTKKKSVKLLHEKISTAKADML